MKKIFLFSAALILFFNARMTAQVSDIVTFNADLVNIFAITVTAGNTQTATFDTPAEYNAGIAIVGNSVVQVESTDDWYCDINAAAANFVPGTGSGNLPVDNIGLWCEAIGANTFGNEITLTQANTSLATALGITGPAPVRLFDLGAGSNAGGQAENEFRLNWAMGTMDNTMHATSMLYQLGQGDFGLGTYSTVITLTATQIP